MTMQGATPDRSTTGAGRIGISGQSSADEVRAAVSAWVEDNVPPTWVEAGRRGGPPAVRQVRNRSEYEYWYPVFGASGASRPAPTATTAGPRTNDRSAGGRGDVVGQPLSQELADLVARQ